MSLPSANKTFVLLPLQDLPVRRHHMCAVQAQQHPLNSLCESSLVLHLTHRSPFRVQAHATTHANTQVQALEQAQQGQRAQPATGAPGRGKSFLRFALRSAARLGMYSAIAVATVAGTHSDQVSACTLAFMCVGGGG